MTVPSGLIPTRITSLPSLPQATVPTDILMVVSGGVTYQTTFSNSYVTAATQVIAGTNLTGGGVLTSDVTLNLIAATSASVLFGRGSASSGGAFEEITLGAGLSMSGTTLTAPEVGTVTSVAQSFTGGLISVSGSPITATGTLALTVAGTSGGIPYFSGTTTWASSGALTASALVLGGGAGAAPTPMGSLGSTTTVLHGNVAGAPTFAAVSLTADITGTLGVANGGTGITALGTGVATWLGTPSSANLLAAVTDETGTGLLVFGSTPTLETPVFTGLPTGTGVAAAATVSTLVSRDASANVTTNNFVSGYTTTATAAGTTTLTVTSTELQFFTGATTQTVVLPVTSTLALGFRFKIVNNSTGVVTVQSSGANNIIAMVALSEAVFTCILTSGTDALSWDGRYTGTTAVTGTGAFVLAVSPSLTTPALGTPASGVLSNCTGYPGIIAWSAITADPAPAVANTGYMCDTSGGAFTVTLPAAPAVGEQIILVDAASTFDTLNLTVDRNALNIMGVAEDMTITLEGAWVTLVYQGATNGWRVSA